VLHNEKAALAANAIILLIITKIVNVADISRRTVKGAIPWWGTESDGKNSILRY